MTMEKRGVINQETPGQCCGGSSCSSEKKADERRVVQHVLPFPESEPDTEKQADDMQESALNSAIDAVVEETDGSTE
jgi:hypothetical protein